MNNNPWIAVGRAGMAAEETGLRPIIDGVPRFRQNHPLWYAALAFIIGGGVVAAFTMSTYAWWVHYPIDVVTAVYQIVIGGVLGGLATIVLAFAAAATLQLPGDSTVPASPFTASGENAQSRRAT